MRFFLCLPVLLAAVLVSADDLLLEGSGVDNDLLPTSTSISTDMDLLTTTEMPITTRDPVRKWNHADLLAGYEKKSRPCDQAPIPVFDEVVGACPTEWFHYRESCYLIKQKMVNMTEADKICQDFQTTLFVADTQEELNMITNLAKDGNTWMGLFKKDEATSEWQANCGMDIEKLPWLVGAGEDHGWNEKTRCAAYHKNGVNSYTHFYPCSREMNFICERNATLYM